MHRSRYMCSTIAVTIVVLATLLAGPTAADASTPDQILSGLAAQQTHSWIDNSLGATTHVARYKAGHRLSITCAPVSEVARRLLAENGYVARVVQVITHEPWNYLTDGHAMLEVWADERWQLYDVDANLQAVDEAGNGIGLLAQMDAVREGRALWREIASDPLYHEDEPDLAMRAVAVDVFSNPEAFYRRVMGTAFFPRDAEGTGYTGVWYINDDQTERLRAAGLLTGRYLADPRTWYNLTGVLVTAVAPAPTPAVVTAAPAAQTVPTATVTATATTTATAATVAVPAIQAKPKRSCRALRQQYKRTHTRRARRRFIRCMRAKRRYIVARGQAARAQHRAARAAIGVLPAAHPSR